MWRCKHCGEEFDLDKSGRANHSRWCDHNPKRESWNKGRGTVSRYGEFKTFEVKCAHCGTNFEVEERENIFPSKTAYYCSRSCSSAIGGKTRWKDDESLSSYSIVCFRHHERKCIVCGFDKVVAVHHVNEVHSDNRPENLVPLCPNHHEMFHHTEFRDEVEPFISDYLVKRWAHSGSGKTAEWHSAVGGSIPPGSTTNSC